MPLDCNSLAAAVALMLADRLNLDDVVVVAVTVVGVSGLEGVVKALLTNFPEQVFEKGCSALPPLFSLESFTTEERCCFL